jgi:hypothetical protein
VAYSAGAYWQKPRGVHSPFVGEGQSVESFTGPDGPV